MTTQRPQFGAVLTGRDDYTEVPAPAIESWTPAAAADSGGVAAGPRASWPGWAADQLRAAAAIARGVPARASVAAVLYREWFNPAVGGVELLRARRPLAGVYRGAHAATGVRVSGDLDVLERHDVVGADGWWRTWGEAWTPPRSRPGSVRVLMTPRAEHRADLVRTVTAAFAGSPAPWSLACATDPKRARRYASTVLDLPGPEALSATLLAELAPLVYPVTPPLCLPVSPGAALAAYPDTGMSFGEHRCHLIALALRRPSAERDPLRSIAGVFAAHGIDPARPHGV